MTTESAIMVVGVGTYKASGSVVVGLVTHSEETDNGTPTAHMRKFDEA